MEAALAVFNAAIRFKHNLLGCEMQYGSRQNSLLETPSSKIDIIPYKWPISE
jgi:hypothetical protein